MDSSFLRDLRSAEFHPWVFRGIVLLGVLFVLAAWAFFSGSHSDVALGVVSFFVVVSMGLVALLFQARRSHPRDDLGDREVRPESFDSWASRDVDTSTGRVRGSVATIETWLPIAAVAVGMVAFAVVLQFAGHA